MGRASARTVAAALALGLVAALVPAGPGAEAQRKPKQVEKSDHPRAKVFDLPALPRMEAVGLLALSARRVDQMRQVARIISQRFPGHPAAHVWTAAAAAAGGRTEEGLEAVRAAVRAGLPEPERLAWDRRLAGLGAPEEIAAAIEAAKPGAGALPAYLRPAEPSAIVNQEARITPDNTEWDDEAGALRALFAVPPVIAKQPAIKENWRKAFADRLNRLVLTGEAAGNAGDLYDNRDRGHAALNHGLFRQVSSVVYGREAKRRRLDYGRSRDFRFNRPTFGNSSTAHTGNWLWRSQARFAMTEPGGPESLWDQYVSNQMYAFPEHRDHDADGRGDLFPANTPYMFISQGSSGSDQAFLWGMATALAALRPETKALAMSEGLLAPTVQMIMRRARSGGTGGRVASDAQYLSPAGHQTAYPLDRRINLMRILNEAQRIEADALPPVVRLRVESEPSPRPGVEMFSGGVEERMFDTPSAIARIHRSVGYARRMVVSAAATRDPNGRPLSFEWRLVRGDADRVRIEPRGESGETAELFIPWHDPYPVPGAPGLRTHRVDIAVFAHNGVHYSAPAFVSVAFPPRQNRRYHPDGRVDRVSYPAPPKHRGQYADPKLFLTQGWTDDYDYDAEGRLTGWRRKMKGAASGDLLHFTPQGLLVLERGPQGRPTLAAEVRYERKRLEKSVTLEMVETGRRVAYWYSGPDDRTGTAVTIEPGSTDGAAAE